MRYPTYISLPQADTAASPLPLYMTVDRVAKPCRTHVPLALQHMPPPGNVVLQLKFGFTNKYIVCAACGATAIHGMTRLRWSDIDNLKVKTAAIEYNKLVAEAKTAVAA